MPTPNLLPYEVALERLLAMADVLPTEILDITQAHGRILAEPPAAKLSQPSSDLSAMDGYALRFADLGHPLDVIGESAAGRRFTGTIGPRQAVRIFTGAHVPIGADTVAVQEDAVREGHIVRFPKDGPPHMGAHIRKRGLDFTENQILALAGDRLTPARLGLLATAGLARVTVHRRPKIAILSNGDELVPIGQMPRSHQIIGANSLMISAMLQEAGAHVTDLGIVPDNRADILHAIQSTKGFDILVTIGGASVGDHDLVKPCLEEAGAQMDFWKVAIRPGKPLMAGKLDDTLVVGLPGNPVSAHMCARIFLWPLIAHLSGQPHQPYSPVLLQTTQALSANGPRRHFMRATAAHGHVTPASNQDSSLYDILAQANALIVRAENAEAVPIGGTVPVLLF